MKEEGDETLTPWGDLRDVDESSGGDGGGRGGGRWIEDLADMGAVVIALTDGDRRRSTKGWNMPWWVSLQKPKR